MPITYADTPAAVEEERRLLYVGITRARVHLWVSWSLARNPGGQARRKPSRFLAGPASRVGHRPRRGLRLGARRHGARAGRLQCASGASDRWRARASATAATAASAPCPTTRSSSSRCAPGARSRPTPSAPAFVVFSDATLEALAEVRPTDRSGLPSISGIGKTKLDKYADELLRIIA